MAARANAIGDRPKRDPRKRRHRKIGELEGEFLLEKHAPYWQEHLYDDEVVYQLLSKLKLSEKVKG